MIRHTPFSIQTFNTFIKVYLIMFVISVFAYFIISDSFQKERTLIFTSLFLLLWFVLMVGKKLFLNKKHEKISLWLLYISMILSTVSFPVMEYITESYLNISDLVRNCILMFVIGISMAIYIMLLEKYGKNFLSKKLIEYMLTIPHLMLLVIPLYLYRDYDVFSKTFVWIGSFLLTGALIQYPRLKIYLNKNDIERYGSTTKYVKEKKGMK